MINTRPIFLILLAFSLWSGKANGQISISNEIGVVAGPAGFFTDYGERYNIRNNLENRGFGVGLVHYMNFAFKPFCSCKADEWWFSEHFRIRNEIDYLRSNLKHYGPVSSKNNEGGRQLRAMHGTTQLFQIGSSLEYHFYGIKEARDFGVTFAPYISLGVHYVYYQPEAYSDLGSFDSPKVLFPTFEGGLDLSDETTFAILGSAGVRYRVGRSNDILIEGRWMYYDSDYIEGLNVMGPQNKFNDFIFWLNLGYVYYLDF
ncbi:THC0290_0291 family protein [Christiangramia salexigens]|uniref:Glutamate dehydrogenase n=1 Tax=Christiangramia salexigens TaxID=1913577 RepID=A0A1L3J704_9FLAO|nr:glutamate dehydrogenase [Christiangramia salexigens]APG60890.1 glutamate dehydrogenase [Christiangramia salexigens]